MRFLSHHSKLYINPQCFEACPYCSVDPTLLSSMPVSSPLAEPPLLPQPQALTGDNSTTRINGRQHLQPMQFAEEVLGFEDYRQTRNIIASDGGSRGLQAHAAGVVGIGA